MLLTVDFFGLTVALPQIGKDLHASTETLAWTVNAYLVGAGNSVTSLACEFGWCPSTDWTLCKPGRAA